MGKQNAQAKMAHKRQTHQKLTSIGHLNDGVMLLPRPNAVLFKLAFSLENKETIEKISQTKETTNSILAWLANGLVC